MVAKSLVIIVVAVVVAAVVGSVLAYYFLFPRGPVIELWYNNDSHYGDTEDEVAQVLKAQLERAGVFRVELKSSAWAQFTEQFERGELPFFLLGWFPDYPDPDTYVNVFMTPRGSPNIGSFYNSSQGATLVQQEVGGPVAERAQRFEQLQDLLAQDVPYVPIWQTGAVAVQEKGVTGVVLDPFLFRYYLIGKPGATEFFMSTTDRLTDLDPHIEYDLFSGTVVGNIFDTLYMTTPTNGSTEAQIVPLIASANPTNPGGNLSIWDVPLRSGLEFSNNDPITAEDVRWSFLRFIKKDIAGSAAFLFTSIIDKNNAENLISCPDDPSPGDNDCTGANTIRFQLNQSYSIFPSLLTFSGTAILNKRVFNGNFATNMTGISVPAGAGSGPYQIAAGSDRNTRIILEANPNYNFRTGFWQNYASVTTVPVMSKFTINLKTDATALRQDIEAHSTTGVNLAYRSLNPPDITALKDNTELDVLQGASPQIRYLVFNVNKKPFDNVNMRKAIANLVDRAEIVNTVFQGVASPLWSLVPPGFLGHKDVFKDVYGETPNIDQAKQLLREVQLAMQPSELLMGVARD